MRTTRNVGKDDYMFVCAYIMYIVWGYESEGVATKQVHVHACVLYMYIHNNVLCALFIIGLVL